MNPIPSPEVAKESLIDRLRTLAPEKLRDAVKAMTTGDLEELITKMESTREVPEIFRDASARDLIDRRITELAGVSDDTRTKWQVLKAKIEGNTEGLKQEAEKSVLRQIIEKGGPTAVVAGIGVAILAFFGVKWAKALKEGGVLNFAKEHPIFLAFLSALGVSAGYTAIEYFKQNEHGITEHIKWLSAQSGKPLQETAITVAEKVKDGIREFGADTLDNLNKGIVWALDGTVDEETGVVTLPRSTLRPMALVAYQAVSRLSGGGYLVQKIFPWLGVERKLDALLSETDRAVSLSNEQRHMADKARRASSLMKEQFHNGVLPREKTRELQGLLDELAPELGMTPDEAKRRGILASKGDTETMCKDLAAAERKAIELNGQQSENYKRHRDALKHILKEANDNIAKGNIPAGESPTSYKRKVLADIQVKAQAYTDELRKNKLAMGNELAQAYDFHAKNHLDARIGNIAQINERVERLGFKMMRTTAGRWAVRGFIGYSCLPVVMEGMSALSHGLNTKEGQVAAKAFRNDLISVGGGFIPVVGEALDFYSAISGKDLNGRELSAGNRVLMATMGTLGTASIALGFFTGGASIVAFRGLRASLAGTKAWRVVRAAKSVARVTDSAADIAKTAKAGERAAESVRALSTVTDFQRAAARARSIVHTAQRGVQTYVYGHLGFQLICGAVELYSSGEAMFEKGKEKAIQGVDAVEKFIGGQTQAA